MWVQPLGHAVGVALLAEGVDRNIEVPRGCCVTVASPSSRRAWIEISPAIVGRIAAQVALLAEGVDRNVLALGFAGCCRVALLAEGVDRNIFWVHPCFHLYGRPPRGGRG